MSGQDPVTHIHISEREADGSWEDCTWDAGLEFFRDAFDPSQPATHAEAQQLRAASGEPPTGGSNMTDLHRGVKARYNVSLPAPINAHNILIALKPGDVSVVQGSMSAFGPLHPLSQWDRNFDGGHAVWLARTPGGKLLWCDPEAPKSADVPIVISSADVQKYVNAFAGTAIVAPALKWPMATVPKETSVEPITQYLPGYAADVRPSSNVRDQPHISATKLRTTTVKEPVVLIGTVKGDVDPGNGKDVWYMWWKNGRYEFTATDNITNVTAPAAGAVDDGYTKATQDAAVLKATADEKERIAIELGRASSEAVRLT